MDAVFLPGAPFHIGGDEVEGSEWNSWVPCHARTHARARARARTRARTHHPYLNRVPRCPTNRLSERYGVGRRE
jgi:hypothetical protein